MIEKVSYSRLAVYEQCPLRAKYAFVDHIKELPDPTEGESPLDRGTRVHEACEQYIRGQIDELPLEDLSDDHRAALAAYRDIYSGNHEDKSRTIEIEQMWCFDEAWQIVDDFATDLVIRAKLDVAVLTEELGIIDIVDFKTGRKYRNEVKHQDQMQLYAVAAKMRYPWVEQVGCLLLYLDQGENTYTLYNAATIEALAQTFNKRITRMLEDRLFLPKPSVQHCSYCPYKTGNLGRTQRPGTGTCILNP